MTTRFISRPNSLQSRFAQMRELKKPAHNSNQRNASCAGRENPINETGCDADEHVAELELRSRLRFVGTLPNTRSHSEIPQPAPG
jgi:hypothetical protein